jgi:glycosyltransferase involved in cell wall biosynthesis
MKVLMLSPDAQMIDRRILQEARTLLAAGHDVDLLSGFECREPDAYEDRGLRVKRYRYDWQDRRRERLRARVGPLAGRVAWPFVRLANRALDGANAFEAFVLEKVLQHSFDVVHVHDFPMLRTGVMAAKARGVPVVYDSHEFYPVQSCFSPEDQKRYLAMERKLVRDCAQVITVNPYIARMLAEAHDTQEPQVILNACEIPATTSNDLDSEERRRRRLEKGLPPDAFIFVYQGWLSPERNLEPMIEAMASQPPNVALLVVGYGDYLATLEKLAETHGVRDRVIFYGRVESDDLPALTQLCDVGIIPYRAVDEMHRYCSPNKLFEFISAQIPMLASDLPYLRDVIAGHEIGWLGNLEEPAGFAQLMQQVIADKTGLAAARGNLPKAAAELNWDVEGRKLVDIYDRLARMAKIEKVASR